MGSGGGEEASIPLLNKQCWTKLYDFFPTKGPLQKQTSTCSQPQSVKYGCINKAASQTLKLETRCNRLVTPGNVPQ